MFSHITCDSLFTNREFMHSPIKPRFESSVHAVSCRKFAVRCISMIPTCGAGSLSGLYSAPIVFPGENWIKSGLLCANTPVAAKRTAIHAMAQIAFVAFIAVRPPRLCQCWSLHHCQYVYRFVTLHT